MLNKLKDLVFGLDEYEKTKIEIRFQLINDLYPQIVLKELKDFELLEECISKIKDLLRLKSSNINKTIKDPSRPLTKQDVANTINNLNNIKYAFLEKAFNIIQNQPEQQEEITTPIQTPPKAQQESKIVLNENDIEENSKITKTKHINLQDDENYKITLENGKIPYILIDFKTQIDYSLLKNISSILYEQYKAEGTNIIIEQSKALIIPRFNDDNLFELPRNQYNLDEIHEKILSHKNKEETSKKPAEEIKNTDQEEKEKNDEDYLEYNTKPTTYKTKKYEEDSLDAILTKNESYDFSKHPDPKKDNSQIIFEKADPIEIEKKEKEEEHPQIEIERKEIKSQEEPKPQMQKTQVQETQLPKEQEETQKQSPTPNENLPKHTIYSDDTILVYLKENSKVFGELIIQLNNQNPNQNDISYMMIFSKIFSSILFEQLEAHGTNIIMNFKDNSIKIIPRYQDDKLPINWTPKEESDSFLEDIKTKLINKMQSTLNNQSSSQENQHKEQSSNQVQQIEQKESEIQKNETEDEKKKKAKYILEQLRKIP